MKRIFRKGCVTVDGSKYEPVIDYDVSILNGESVEVSRTCGGQQKLCIILNNHHKALIGTAAMYMILRGVS